MRTDYTTQRFQVFMGSHGGEATQVIENFRELSDVEKQQIVSFLKTL